MGMLHLVSPTPILKNAAGLVGAAPAKTRLPSCKPSQFHSGWATGVFQGKPSKNISGVLFFSTFLYSTFMIPLSTYTHAYPIYTGGNLECSDFYFYYFCSHPNSQSQQLGRCSHDRNTS